MFKFFENYVNFKFMIPMALTNVNTNLAKVLAKLKKVTDAWIVRDLEGGPNCRVSVKDLLQNKDTRG